MEEGGRGGEGRRERPGRKENGGRGEGKREVEVETTDGQKGKEGECPIRKVEDRKGGIGKGRGSR